LQKAIFAIKKRICSSKKLKEREKMKNFKIKIEIFCFNRYSSTIGFCDSNDYPDKGSG